MKKKLAALISAAAVAMSAVPMLTPAYAVEQNFYDVLMGYADKLIDDSSPFEIDDATKVITNKEPVEVTVDMKARKSGASDWKDKVENNTYSAGTRLSSVMKFDYRATLDMSKVLEQYNTVTNLAGWAIELAAMDYEKELTEAGTLDADAIAAEVEAYKAARKAELEASYVKGAKFVITVENPDGLSFPEGIEEDTDMTGFTARLGDNGEEITPNDEGKLIIAGDEEDAERGNLIYIEAEPREGGSSELTITIGTEGEVSNKALAEALKYDIILEYDDIEATGPSGYSSNREYKLVGTVTGNTPIYIDTQNEEDPDGEPVATQVADLSYEGIQDTSSSSLYDNADEISETIKITTNSRPSSPGGGGGGIVVPRPTPTVTPTTPPELNREDHYAYIVGYPDGSVQPNGSITRAEVATIFFRLLTDESRAEAWSTENSFSDVNSSDWYNNAISTMANAGVVNGYDDGTFKPNAPITRAEFAAIAARFDTSSYSGADKFTDIAGHWAGSYINKAADLGWINGYDDGTFKPDQNITRAEAMTLVNNVLNRHVQSRDYMLDGMAEWFDNTEDMWYYTAVQEATNSHTYERLEDGVNEQWTEITENRDWTALENEAATANSGN